MPRIAGSGRKRGRPNRLTGTIAERLATLDCDPAEGLAAIARESRERGDFELAAFAYSKLLPYLFPKLGSLDVRVENDASTADRLTAALERFRQVIAEPQAAPRPAQAIVHAPVSSLPVIDATTDATAAARPMESQVAGPAPAVASARVAPVAPPNESRTAPNAGPAAWPANWSVTPPSQPGPTAPAPAAPAASVADSLARPGLTPAFTASGERRLIGPAPRPPEPESDLGPWWS
jgi:hypothetical protein